MTPDKYIKNYIDGKLMPANRGAYLKSISPSTGKVYAQFPDSTAQDLQFAIETAERSGEKWSSLELEKRYRILMRIADILEQEMKVFAKAEAMDGGKPYSMAISVDVPQAVNCIRFYATSLPHYASDAFYREDEAIHYYIRRPLGVVACVPHWSFSLLSLCQLVIPALVAGNSVVACAAELTPMCAHLFAKACMTAGLPEGVLNIVYGKNSQLVPTLYKNPSIKAIAYWGDPEYGQDLIKHYSSPLKRQCFRLSAKNPAIIFADCNFHKMIVETLRSSFSNNGQHPFSTSRIYVERTIYEKFKEELVKRTQFLKVGDPMSSVTDLGAIISLEKRERLLSFIALAELEGGHLLCGGKVLDLSGDFENGVFFRPAILEGLPASARVNQEDIFGPIISITPFDSDDEVIRLANNSIYGNAATIWTQNTSRANKIAESLKAGIIWINAWMLNDDRASFALQDASGNAIIGGMEALYFFTDKKLIGQPL